MCTELSLKILDSRKSAVLIEWHFFFYFFNEKGYMVKNRDVNGWYLDDNGIGTECIQAEGFE